MRDGSVKHDVGHASKGQFQCHGCHGQNKSDTIQDQNPENTHAMAVAQEMLENEGVSGFTYREVWEQQPVQQQECCSLQ